MRKLPCVEFVVRARRSAHAVKSVRYDDDDNDDDDDSDNVMYMSYAVLRLNAGNKT